MSFLMGRKRTWPRKRLGTDLTCINLFFFQIPKLIAWHMKMVNICFVFPQTAPTTKRFVAMTTFTRLFSSMDSLVIFHVVAPGESFIAILTNERFFPGVHNFVLINMVSLAERFATFIALVRSSIIVNIHVFQVCRSWCQHFSTFFALQRFIFLLFLDACGFKQIGNRDCTPWYHTNLE